MKEKRRGLTVIELLVGISIMVILFAVLVPAVRLISKDARTFNGSTMLASSIADAAATSVSAKSSKRLDESNRVEGNCVILERNPNFVDEDGIFFGVTKIRRGRVALQFYRPEPIEEPKPGDRSIQKELIRVSLWSEYEPPITEEMEPGTEASLNGRIATICEFVYAT